MNTNAKIPKIVYKQNSAIYKPNYMPWPSKSYFKAGKLSQCSNINQCNPLIWQTREDENSDQIN